MIFKAIPFPIPQPERRKLIIHGNLLIDAKAGDKKQARAELEALIDEIREKHGVLYERPEFEPVTLEPVTLEQPLKGM